MQTQQDGGETIIEYSNGRTARLPHSEAVQPVGDTEPAPPLPRFAETLEILPDPFPVARIAQSGVWFDGADSDPADAVETLRGSKPLARMAPYSVELEQLRAAKLPTQALAEAYIERPRVENVPGATVYASADVVATGGVPDLDDPRADALLAIARLGNECAQMLSGPSLTREECLAFIERSKQKLNVVATAAPFIASRGQ